MKRISILLSLLAMICLQAFAQTKTKQQIPSYKWIRTIQEQTIRPYSEGFAAFFEAGKWGFEDINGKIIIPATYEEVDDFSGGVTRVKQNGKWGVMNSKGELIYPCEYDAIEPFSDNTALARKGEKFFYIYSDGRSIMNLPSDMRFYSYSHGLAKVAKQTRKGEKYGYIDNVNGYFQIEPTYDEASDFYGEFAIVSLNGETFFINRKGKKITIDDAYEITTSNTILSPEDGSGFIKRGDKYVFLKGNKNSFTVLPYNLTKVNPFKEGVALIETNNQLRYIRPDGTTALKLTGYDAAGNFSEDLAWVSSNGKYGFIDINGKLVIDTIFSYSSDFNNGYAYVAYGGKKGVIKRTAPQDKFPALEIDDIRLKDMNGNGKVETDERFQIDVTLKNTGKEAVRKVRITLSGKAGQASWFDYDRNNIEVKEIEAGGTSTVSFIGVANNELISEEILVNIRAEADNLMASINSSTDFMASGINQCKPLLASYWVRTENHAPVIKGKPAFVEIEVTNDGTDMAKDVTLALRWPSGIAGKNSEMKVGNIQPGDTKKIQCPFEITDTLDHATYSIVATITDFTKKHSDVKYLSFESGKMNFAVNLITGMATSYVVPTATYAQNTSLENMPAASASEVQSAAPSETSELLSGLTLLKEPDINKYALIIGNEDYNSFKQATLYEPNVDFAVSDAKAFKEYAKNILGVPESNIILLTNATYSQMNFNINKITRIAKLNPDKTEIYVYYAGHGQVDAVSKESYLIPVDVSTTSPTEGVKLEKMYATLSDSRAKRTIVFLDACYSGVGRGIVVQPKETPVKGNLVVMTASSATQRSMPYQEKKHGMFTYFLLKELKDKQGDVTLEQLYQSVKSNVQTNSVWINNMEQTPELISGPGIPSDWKQWKL